MSKVRYTDMTRYKQPYVTAKDSQEPGYLAKRFQAIREQQAKDDAERKEKVRQVGKKAA